MMMVKRNLTFLIIYALSFGLISCAEEINGRAENSPPLVSVSNVDLDKYLGNWYEIARYPNSFERDCYKATAAYSLNKNGSIKVVNSCENSKGKIRKAIGVANIIKGSNGAKLAVNFAPFPLPKGIGNYHIIYLDSEYQNSLVASPNGKYLWILSRNKQIDDIKLNQILSAAKAQGFDINLLEYPNNK